MAFMTRCKLHQMNNSHRNKEKFPYNSDELARYMHYLINNMKPVVEDEYQTDSSEE